VTPSMPPVRALRSRCQMSDGFACWLFRCAPKVRGDMSRCSTAGRILERKGVLCQEVPAAHDRSNRVVTAMEREGESESSSRVEGSAHTPNFWNRSRWSWVGRTGGSRRYCFWKSLCNLPGDLAWTFFRGAGDGLEIGTVGRASLRAQKLEYLGGCRLALVVTRYHESSLPGVINDRSTWRVGVGCLELANNIRGPHR
jgi:hypothetical protein